jgi:hypothetical protein
MPFTIIAAAELWRVRRGNAAVGAPGQSASKVSCSGDGLFAALAARPMALHFRMFTYDFAAGPSTSSKIIWHAATISTSSSEISLTGSRPVCSPGCLRPPVAAGDCVAGILAGEERRRC